MESKQNIENKINSENYTITGQTKDSRIYSKLKSFAKNSWKLLPIGLERYYGRNFRS